MATALRPNFTFKLVLSYCIVIVLSFGLVSFFLSKHLEEQSLHEITDSLIKQTFLVRSQLDTEKIFRRDQRSLDEQLKSLARLVDVRITLIDPRGVVLCDSEMTLAQAAQMENHLYRREIQSALRDGSGSEIRFSDTLRIDMLYAAALIGDPFQPAGVIRLAKPLRVVETVLASIRKTIAFSVVFSLLLAFMLGSLIARGVIRPVNKIIRASRRFISGDLSHRIILDSQDELGQLASTLNIMAQSIEDKVKEVSLQNQHLEAIFNSMIEGVLVLDKDSRIVSVNHAVEQIFGVKKEQAAGALFLEAVRNNDLHEIIRSVASTGRSVSEELSLRWPVERIFQVNAVPVFEQGRYSGCLVVIHDITEIRRLETVRRDFVANVSHELKTPLTSISGFVETLLSGALDDKEHAREFLTIVQEQTARLNNLVNDLLQLSYLESEQTSLSKEHLELFSLVSSIVSGFGSRLEKSRIRVDNNLPKGLCVEADKDKLSQVLINLIDNAVKFGKAGSFIELSARKDGSGSVTVMVKDGGIGIPARDLPRLFERFYRVDKARSRQLGGTGLGLSIVKHIIELHNGTVGVESSEGAGSTFWFTLPA